MDTENVREKENRRMKMVNFRMLFAASEFDKSLQRMQKIDCSVWCGCAHVFVCLVQTN